MKNSAMRSLVIVLSLTAIITAKAYCQGQEATSSWTAQAQEMRIVDKPDEIIAKLGNGLTVIIKEDHSAPVAAVRVHVRAGSIYEGDYLGAGLSHLFEHLLAGGSTSDLTEEQSRQMIKETGAQFNASTSKARTQYYLTVPSRHVGVALHTLASWVTRPIFPENEFSREWGVVQRELEMGTTNVDRQEWRLLDEMRYLIHPAKYPVIGHQEILQALTRKQIMDYYQTMYIPDNCVVAIVGDIEVEKMLEEVKKEFSSFKRKFVPTITLPEEPEVTAPRTVTKVLPFMSGPARVTIAFPSFKLQHPDLYALDTLAGIIGNGKTSRLYHILCEEKQLALDVSATNFTPDYADGTFMIRLTVEQEKIDQAISQTLSILNDIKTLGVTELELHRTKKQLQVNHIRGMQTAVDIASAMAGDYLSTGDAHFSQNYCDNMQKVNAQQVKDMACKYFDTGKLMTLILTGKPLAKAQDEKESVTKESAIKKIVLNNGLRVLIKRNPVTPLVHLRFMVKGGLIDETDSNNGITNMATQLAVRGTESYDNKQILEFFDNTGGYLAPECGNNSFGFCAEVMKDDLAQALDIFTEVITKPAFPQVELDKIRPVVIAGINQIANDWQREASRHFRASFFENNPYKRMPFGTASSVQTITIEQIADHYKAILNANKGVLVVFGDVDVKEIETLISNKFADIPAGADLDLDRYANDNNINRRIITQKTGKEGATVTVGMPGMRLTDVNDSYPLAVLNQMVGSNTGWLHETLRGKSLVYYAFCFDFKGFVPGYITATAQCEADKAPEVLAIIEELLNKAAKGDFTDENVNSAKSNLVNSEVFKTLTLASSAMSAASDELFFNDSNYSAGNADRYMAVTTDDVKNIAKKYLGQQRTITVNTSKPELIK
ncbi:MAG: insulinase family protein [Sedimentisphaerales bacterium]|nr:insulinase family protein [Sedimentisphaerales bacterium]